MTDEKTDFASGFRAGVEAAARMAESCAPSPEPNTVDTRVIHQMGMAADIARYIRALQPPQQPDAAPMPCCVRCGTAWPARDHECAPASPAAAVDEFFEFFIEEVGDDSFMLRTTSSDGEEGVAELPFANVPTAARTRMRLMSVGRISVVVKEPSPAVAAWQALPRAQRDLFIALTAGRVLRRGELSSDAEAGTLAALALLRSLAPEAGDDR